MSSKGVVEVGGTVEVVAEEEEGLNEARRVIVRGVFEEGTER